MSDGRVVAESLNATAEWLASVTPAIQGWKAEEDTFRRYCEQREMGFSPEALARFFTPYWSGDFEARYRGERQLAGRPL